MLPEIYESLAAQALPGLLLAVPVGVWGRPDVAPPGSARQKGKKRQGPEDGSADAPRRSSGTLMARKIRNDGAQIPARMP